LLDMVEVPTEVDLRDLTDRHAAELHSRADGEAIHGSRRVSLEHVRRLKGAADAEEEERREKRPHAQGNEDPDPKLICPLAHVRVLPFVSAPAGSAWRRKNCRT